MEVGPAGENILDGPIFDAKMMHHRCKIMLLLL